jgi:hypothetical protein
VTSLAACPPARHVARLEKGGAKRTAIAATSRLPVGTLRNLAAGRPQISELHEAVLLATTAAMCATATTRRGSRGRIVSADSERIAAGPTHAILSDLAARGFGSAWVARELGYARGLQIGADTVRRRTAKAIAGLAARAEGLTAPPAVRNRRVPPLVGLLECHQAVGVARVEGAA